MAVAEHQTGCPVYGQELSLCGWGRTSRSRASVIRVRSPEEVDEALAAVGRRGGGVIARGQGRSYGDAAQNARGTVLDMTALDRVLALDERELSVTAQAGATIGQLTAELAAHELALPVVPGTRHVTLAGAIASDIHGKNHHRDGALARHVLSIKLCTPRRGLVELSAASEPELFHATLGGMGLTGVIVEAKVRVERTPSPWLSADSQRTDGLAQTLEAMCATERHRYSVAWLDLLADGPRMGRAVISRAEPLSADAPGPRRSGRGADLGASSRRPVLEVPRGFPSALLRPTSMRAFNAVRWRTTPRLERERPLARAPYFFPLDALGQWNRLYGSMGFVQYQFAIPIGQERALESCFELIRARRLPVYLAVFKRFGPAYGGPLSFPLEGWTLAADIPAATPGLYAALDELDELVAGAGGRVYLSKDARMRPQALRAMYPQLERFLEQRAAVDPDGLLRSDLSRRLGLSGAPS